MTPSLGKLVIRAALAALLVVGVLALAAPAPSHAQGGPGAQPPAQPPAQPVDPNVRWGTHFFDDAIRYVARGRNSMPVVRDFYAQLDAKIELDAGTQEGLMRVWFQAPTCYRVELTTNNATTTKILNGNQGWIRTASGRVQNLALSAEGQQAIRQLRDDRDRISDLTQFLTLQGLKGPGIVFRYEGYTTGTGTYAGKWIKISRRAQGKPDMTFWIAYEKTGPNQVRATWPGIVRVAGDPAQNYPTEDYMLKDWDSALSKQRRSFRYPRRIEGYSLLKDKRTGQDRKTRFLFAIVDDVQVNTNIKPAQFQQPR